MKRLLFAVMSLVMFFGTVGYSYGASSINSKIIKPQLECMSKPKTPPKCNPKPRYRPKPKKFPKPSKPSCPTKPPKDIPKDTPQESSSINEPTIMWRGLDWSGDVVASLIGDVIGDSNNEVVCFTADTLSVLNGKTGEVITYWELQSQFSNLMIDINHNEGYLEGILSDINDDGKQEIIFQVRYSLGSLLIAMDGSAQIIWVQETDSNLAFGMKTFRQSENSQLIVFTGSEMRDARTGELLKSNLNPGAIADINNDQALEIITGDAVYNLDYEMLIKRSVEVGVVVNEPVIADLNKDGKPEIILLTTNGLYVFNSDYSLKWYDSNCTFYEPFPSYDLIYKQSAAVGDVNQDDQLEIIVSTFKGSYNDYDPTTWTTNCYSAIGAKLWSFDSLFEPYNGIPNPWLIDVLSDENPELVFVDGAYIMTVYNPKDGSLLFKKPLYDYYFSVPALAVGDVDGDQKSELMVSNICVGAVDVPANIRKIVTPIYDVDSNFIQLTTPYSLIMPNGVLWAVGNQCLVYYDPSTNLFGKINIDFEGDKPVLRQESSTEIGLWSVNKKMQLGIVNTSNCSYQSTKLINVDFRYFNPLQVNGTKYYFTKRLDNGDTALYEENLTNGTIKLLLETVYIDKILGFIDSGTMLVNLDFGRIATLDLTTLNYTNIVNQVACDDAIYLNDKSVILNNRGWIKTTSYDYNNNDLLYHYKNQNFDSILSKATVQDLLKQQTEVLYDITGVTISQKDDDHLYLVARVSYRNEFDPTLPLEFNLNPALHELPYLIEFEISTQKLTYKGIWQENLKIGSFTLANGNIIYALAGNLNTIRSYNLNKKETVEYLVPDDLKKLYSNARVVKIVESNDQVYVLLWEHVATGNNLSKNMFNHHLLKLNLTNGQWTNIPTVEVKGLINGMGTMPKSEYLYIYAGQKPNDTQDITLYEMNTVTGYSKPIYSYNSNTFIPLSQSLCTDQNNRLYFYLPNADDDNLIKYYEFNTGAINSLDLRTGSDGVALLGADANYLYLSIHLTDEWNRVNTYRYDLTTDQLELMWSLYEPGQIDPTMMLGMTHFGYLPYDFSEFSYDSDNKLLYFTDTQNILTTVMEPQTAETLIRLKPVVKGVVRIGKRTYMAVFGYENTGSSPLKVPIGVDNRLNRYYFGTSLPTFFAPGEHTAFWVIFDKTKTVTWTLNGFTVTASKDNL